MLSTLLQGIKFTIQTDMGSDVDLTGWLERLAGSSS